MKHLILCLFSAAVLGMAGFIIYADRDPDPFRDQVVQSLNTWLKSYPQEKGYLQFDKDYYSSGEAIWFKAYLTQDYNPDMLSTNLHVDILDTKGKAVKKGFFPVKNAMAAGNFTLMPDFPAGDYRIRAYTSWMMNFDPGFLFEKDIHIYNPTEEMPENAGENGADTATFGIQFFPEGGDLVDSVESTVAFKANDRNGVPVKITGTLFSSNGDTVTIFNSIHDGMGTFSFTPAAGVKYSAQVRDSAGHEKTISLPAAKPSGIVLHLINARGKFFFQARHRMDDPDVPNIIKLVAQEGGHLVYYATLNLQQGLTGGMIPAQDFPSGIMQITAFKEDGTPLAERLVFVNNPDHLEMTLQPEKLDMGKRAKNTFVLQIPDSLQGSFSVAVTDADQVQDFPYENNILSDLLLTSDIKGEVYDAGWYFEKKDSAREKGLDLIMMTNGWRRFAWKQLLHNKYPELHYPLHNKIEISGQLLERNNPLATGKLAMILKATTDSQTFFISTKTTDQGYFLIDNLSFHDTGYLYYKATDTVHKTREVTVKFTPSPLTKQPYALLHRPIVPKIIESDEALKDFLALSQERNSIERTINNRSIMLQEVTVKAKKVPEEQKTEDRYTSGMFKSDNGYTFDLTKGEPLPYTSILQYLQGRVPGLMISGGASPRASWRGGSPGFYLDEMPSDISTIATIPVDDIALIKVYRPPFLGGFGGADGAIAIYTRRGGDDNRMIGRGFTKEAIPGYTWTREFYSPDYSVPKKVHELPDKRATLYWNPNLNTDSTSHKAAFSFYNTDITKRIRVVIEGMDSNGRPGRVEEVFE